jgi:hypothetical protein
LYCRSLVSEKRIVTPSGKPEWVEVSKHNHYLDCEAMNEAAGHLLNVQKIPVGTLRSTTQAGIVDTKRAADLAAMLAQ